ncbi:MAG TPA: enoyl-CoA hydratase/isomerase family protein [Thermoanaerobaculia bacterium]|jgi:enoyl-CoA hydratase/carnithine racemase|nr:enoyl-CoA hydratase/isomerase family protein [Thermoanaerobaculia bacterium]
MIVTTDHGPVRELRLDRPPANALTPELIIELREALTRAPGEGVKAMVLSGRPGRFSGGLDVPYLLPLDRAGMEILWRELYRMLHALAASPIPIAAAVTGHSPAGGAVMALFCDYRIMAEGEFLIGLNEVLVGIPMPLAIHQALSRLVGPGKAERLCVEGRLLPSAEALRAGFVDELAPPDRVIERAVEWASGLLRLPPIALARTRKAARADLVRIMEEGLSTEIDLLVDNWFTEEAQAHLHALVERLAKKK